MIDKKQIKKQTILFQQQIINNINPEALNEAYKRIID